MKFFKITLLLIGFCFAVVVRAQETLPIYSDYLSDNVFLVHPSAAGIGNCAKLRLTQRQQWSGNSDAPALQTLSFHARVGEKTGLGFILYNDKNGFNSQKGLQLAYAFHLNFGDYASLNQLSFGLATTFVQNSLDETNFTTPDPVITSIIESNNYFNADFSIAYHYLDSFTYFTIKNLLLSARGLYNNKVESLNLRRYIVTFGYYFGRQKAWQFEPSLMMQFIELTGEKLLDVNIKAYKKLQGKYQFLVGLSYRNSLEQNSLQKLKLITPIIGLNFGRYMVSYTYTNQLGNINFQNGGYHQFTLGVNLFCKAPRAAGCPNINSMY